MIPKRAFFTWVGDEPLPWLRQFSIDSFARHNPDWDVDLIRVPYDPGLLAAQSTDIQRHLELATMGGVYFDTDIVFFKRFPEEHLDADVAITIDKSAFQYAENDPHANPDNEHRPGFSNLACMGATPDNMFFHFVYQTAIKRLKFLSEDDVDIKKHLYQAFGTDLLNRVFLSKTPEQIADQFNVKMHNLPLALVLPIRWNKTHKLFNGTEFDPPAESVGVHWYGGCVDAKMYQEKVRMENRHFRPCYLTDAIDAALGLR